MRILCRLLSSDFNPGGEIFLLVLVRSAFVVEPYFIVLWPTVLLQDSAVPATKSSHETRNTLTKYLTMHHFVTEMCTHVHISVTKWCTMEYGTSSLWDFYKR